MSISFSNQSGQLVFELARGPAPKAYLSISNPSDNQILFKVRTTQPMWYFVRPNQDVIQPGQTIELVFTLTEPECERFLQLHRSGTPEGVDKHRFLIQSRTIDEAEYSTLSAMSPDSADRLAEYTRLWETGDREERKLNKYKVQFQYPNSNSATTQQQQQRSRPTEHGDDSQGSHSQADLPRGLESPSIGGSGGGIGDSRELNQGHPHPDSYESCWAELQALKKRFDQIREYTVNLTVDRDNVVSKLEALQQEMAEFEATDSVRGDRGGHLNQAGSSPTKATNSLYMEAFYILLAALVSFIFGRFLSYRS